MDIIDHTSDEPPLIHVMLTRATLDKLNEAELTEVLLTVTQQVDLLTAYVHQRVNGVD
jgi:hypothetical protein